MLVRAEEYENPEFKMDCFLFSDGTLNVYYTGGITPTFIQDVSTMVSQYAYKKFRLILNSPGGEATCIQIAPLMFKQIGLFEIFSICNCSSAALAICLEAKKAKIPVFMDPNTHIVLHKSSQTEMYEGRSSGIERMNKGFVDAFEKVFDTINAPVIKKISADEKRSYEAGHNIYLLGNKLLQWKIFKVLDADKFKDKFVPYSQEVSQEISQELLEE